MEAIQNLLTIAIETVAIAGLTGIIAHAFYTSHCRGMQTYCPKVLPYTPDTQVEETKVDKALLTPDIPSQPEQPAIADPWQAEITTSSPRYWVRSLPQAQPNLFLLPPSIEEAKQPTKKSRKTPASPKAPAKPRTTRKRKIA